MLIWVTLTCPNGERVRILALVDSGSDVNLLSQKIVKLHSFRKSEEPAIRYALSINDYPIRLYDPVDVPLVVTDVLQEERNATQTFHGTELRGCDMILGMP